MKDAFASVIAFFTSVFGDSKIIVLFLLSILAVIIINEKADEKSEGRRINPAVFLLSIWTGISYAAVALLKKIEKKKKLEFVFLFLVISVIIIFSANTVFSVDGYKNSIYYFTDNKITIVSIAAILTYFILYYLISRQLFKERIDRVCFMIFVLLLHSFANYSEVACSFSIFLSPVTIKSLVIHDVMPLLLWIYLCFQDEINNYFISENIDSVDDDEEYLEEWDMKKHKILNMRNMAIVIAVFFVAFIAVVFILNQKINSLYNATVMLENAANTKMSVYEINGEDGTTYLTVMISPEGTVTCLGSGDKANGEEAYELISQYTDKVDKWYLYGDDEKNRGAYDFVKDQGIEIKETYIITGVEKID